VFSQARSEVLGRACVMNRLVGLTNENINIEEVLPLLACQAARLRFAPAWQPSLFAPRSKSEGWRRGELNPCPRRYPRRHLHVYPAMSFKEPDVAPAHCPLPSAREIDSQIGAVAPPICQPAVLVSDASRRRIGNVAVN
jgi:hypothetical protein